MIFHMRGELPFNTAIDDNSNRPTYCMMLLFAIPHLVARKSLSNKDSAICGERKSITMACKLAKFPQQNCIVQNQFMGPRNRHHMLRRLFKHFAGHTVEALYCVNNGTSKQWPLINTAYNGNFLFVCMADRFEITGTVTFNRLILLLTTT